MMPDRSNPAIPKLTTLPGLTDAVEAPATPRLRNRVAALAMLSVSALALVALARTTYFAITDSWVAPLHLSRDNDQVLALQQKVSREEADMARVEAELARIDGDLAAVEVTISRLASLQGDADAPLAWQADVHGEEKRTLGRVIASLRDEVKTLERARARQAELTAAVRRDHEARLVDRREVERQEQALDALDVALAEKRRMLEQHRAEEKLATSRAETFRGGKSTNGVMPEIAASREHAARVELELVRLEAEKRNLQAVRAVAEQGLATQRELLRELRSRPLYRALDRATDVAFVPYDQLEGIRPGARVMACTWGLVLCRDVGQVTEILQGEVATQDPWGEMARGQYAILQLDDPSAVREKVLRLRM